MFIILDFLSSTILYSYIIVAYRNFESNNLNLIMIYTSKWNFAYYTFTIKKITAVIMILPYLLTTNITNKIKIVFLTLKIFSFSFIVD